MTEQGGGFVNPPYGQPSPREKDVVRMLPAGNNPFPTGSRTRIEKLYGAITPNCLLFERDHVGVPAIDQARHRLMIHGLVSRPLLLTMDELMRFPSVSRSGRRPPNCGMRRTAGTAPWRTEAARISLAVAA